MVRDGEVYRLLSDHLGSVRLVVDAETGTSVVQRLEYDEFGRVMSETGTAGFQPFGFAGGLYDRDTGLVRFGARDYDPEIGRWTSRDPILFAAGGVNLYGYALSDPVNYVDVTGFTQEDIDVAVEFLRNFAPDLTIPENISAVGTNDPGALAEYDPWSDTAFLQEKYLGELTNQMQEQLVQDLIHEAMHASEALWEHMRNQWFGEPDWFDREALRRYNDTPDFEKFRKNGMCPAP
jgi:RHS repeat-associated protein